MREEFESALREDRFDEVTHRAYADWLYEQGEDDLATYHREWTVRKQQAENYLRDFAERVSSRKYEEDVGEDEYPHLKLSYERLLEGLEKFLDADGDSDIYLSWDTPELVYEEKDRMWEEYAALTGRDVSLGQANMAPFRCSC